MDPRDNRLSTHPIQTGSKCPIELYPNEQFGYIDTPDRQFGAGSVPTWTRTRSDGPEQLLTLALTTAQIKTIEVEDINKRYQGKTAAKTDCRVITKARVITVEEVMKLRNAKLAKEQVAAEKLQRKLRKKLLPKEINRLHKISGKARQFRSFIPTDCRVCAKYFCK